ncbi:hypothetical protein KM043_010636 [Ampulex compressa]|nr:hypothetical protein KM043_010636 [Ampulex compressa]
MQKVFINVARGHGFSALSPSLPVPPRPSAPLAPRADCGPSRPRNMHQTTVNQWASSAGSHPGIFPDGQRQQHRQHNRGGGPTSKGGRERERERESATVAGIGRESERGGG